jgi:hypothetical protein
MEQVMERIARRRAKRGGSPKNYNISSEISETKSIGQRIKLPDEKIRFA